MNCYQIRRRRLARLSGSPTTGSWNNNSADSPAPVPMDINGDNDRNR